MNNFKFSWWRNLTPPPPPPSIRTKVKEIKEKAHCLAQFLNVYLVFCCIFPFSLSKPSKPNFVLSPASKKKFLWVLDQIDAGSFPRKKKSHCIIKRECILTPLLPERGEGDSPEYLLQNTPAVKKFS